jgi:hypothetical protein
MRGTFSETHPKRQATQHGCLPSWLGDGGKGIEKVNGEEKLGRLEQPRQKKNLLYRHDMPNEPREDPFYLIYPL